MNTVSLALRNLLRNRRRSLMTLIAMVLGLLAVLLFGGYIRAIAYSLQSFYVVYSGHLQIQSKGFFLYGSGNPAAYGVRDYEKIISIVKNDPALGTMVLVVTPTLQFGGIGGNFAVGASRTIFASGVVVAEQNRMLEWNDYNFKYIPKPLTLTGTAANSAVIGTGVARVLQLCSEFAVAHCDSAPKASAPVGNPKLPEDIATLAATNQADAALAKNSLGTQIEILAANASGAPNVAAVNVVGAEFQGIKEIDDIYVGLHLRQAQKLIFGNGPAKATAIVVQLRHTYQIPKARARLEELFAATLKDEPLEVLDYETLNPFYGQTMSMFGAIFGFISILIGVVVLFTIGNTMSTSVVERTVEIGTVRAMGLRRRGIQQMFLAEALVLGVVGSLLGVAMALAFSWAINAAGLTWTPPGRADSVPLTVRVGSEHLMMAGSTLGLIVIASLSALLPAVRASRLKIVDALRHA